MALDFRGVHAAFLIDTTPEIDLEGSLSCGKTTVALWKELIALHDHPGIWSLIARWTDDATKTLLQPAFEQLARIHGTTWDWNRDENAYEFPNGSRAFSFGLKTQSQKPEDRYGKIRGLPVSRIYIDQAEQIPEDIASELRLRLRPDIEARMKGVQYPRQLTFSPNPVNDDHWLAKQFPTTNAVKGRKYYSLSLYDNAHNLPAEMIQTAEATYPPEHPKHQTVILGQRGLNVIGEAVYEHLFDRKAHVRPLEYRGTSPLLEGFECGKHNPVWVVAQRTPSGGLSLLGGIIGKRLMLEDFLPIVKRYRSEWFPETATFRTCTAPIGSVTQSTRYTLIQLLRRSGFAPIVRDHGNAHDVQLTMIEELASYLRRRTLAREEAFGINADRSRWLSMAADGTLTEKPFLAFGFEGGYVWSDHWVSVGNKTVRQPHDDDEYANAMRAVEHLVLNFCAGQLSESEREQRARQQRERYAESSGLSEGPLGWMSH